MAKTTSHSPEPRVHGRIECLDAYRGFVILLMIFVNYVAGIGGVPDWIKHAPGGVDAYTIVDLVLPGFLFIVGVAIPLSLSRRTGKPGAVRELAVRIGRRTLLLLFLGVVMVSMGNFSPEATGIGRSLWSLLFFLCVFGVLSAGPDNRRLGYAIKAVAALVMAWLLFIFRQKTGDDAVVWFRTSWWGILGIIGWTYLAGSVAYLATGGSRTGLMAVLGLTLAIYIGGQHGSLPGFLSPIGRYVHIGGLFGSHAAIVVAGAIVGSLFTGRRNDRTPGSRMRFMFLFGVGLYVSGMLIRPLHGISKLGGTDAYALVTAGECCLGFLLFYWLMDVRRLTRWAAPFSAAGRNALAAYVLPTIVGGVLGLTGTSGWFWWSWSGWTGVANAAVMTVLVLGITVALTRFKVILKL